MQQQLQDCHYPKHSKRGTQVKYFEGFYFGHVCNCHSWASAMFEPSHLALFDERLHKGVVAWHQDRGEIQSSWECDSSIKSTMPPGYWIQSFRDSTNSVIFEYDTNWDMAWQVLTLWVRSLKMCEKTDILISQLIPLQIHLFDSVSSSELSSSDPRNLGKTNTCHDVANWPNCWLMLAAYLESFFNSWGGVGPWCSLLWPRKLATKCWRLFFISQKTFRNDGLTR